MSSVVHQTYIARQEECTLPDMYGGKGSVHAMHMARTKVTPRPKTPQAYRRTFIRQWRESKEMTLETLAGRGGAKIGGMPQASLSRIERGLQPYSQPILEAIADELTNGDVASLLMRDPS